MAIIAITTNNSISVKALRLSCSFGRVDVEEVLFDFIGKGVELDYPISIEPVNTYLYPLAAKALDHTIAAAFSNHAMNRSRWSSVEPLVSDSCENK